MVTSTQCNGAELETSAISELALITPSERGTVQFHRLHWPRSSNKAPPSLPVSEKYISIRTLGDTIICVWMHDFNIL